MEQNEEQNSRGERGEQQRMDMRGVCGVHDSHLVGAVGEVSRTTDEMVPLARVRGEGDTQSAVGLGNSGSAKGRQRVAAIRIVDVAAPRTL